MASTTTFNELVKVKASFTNCIRIEAYEMHEDGLERQDDSTDGNEEPKRKRIYRKNLQNPRLKQGPSTKTSTESEGSSSESEEQWEIFSTVCAATIVFR